MVQQNLTPFDYEQKKMLAVKAMQSKPNPTDYRVPNSAWSGYGLSQSTPLTAGGDMNKVKYKNTFSYLSPELNCQFNLHFPTFNLKY